ncbi:hypothetical protein KAR91_79710 [Candidatus Pacearchaeota archaeon]|nr:hypothetical protein [Candidatus Pacearchaeota archaeon]
MPPTIVRSYQQEIVETMLEIARLQNWWSAPINLGGGPGSDGGSGVPIGDFAGQLIQSRVAFDTTEGESLDIPGSGASLVTNLNRIRGTRNRKVVIVDESTQIGSGIRVIEFHGLPVTVNLVSGYTDRVVVAISGMGWPVSGSGIVNVSATDTLAQYLDTKIAGGNKITTTILNPGGSEQLQIDLQNISLGELSDVEPQTPIDDQEILAYGTAASVWANRTKAQLGLSETDHVHLASEILDGGGSILGGVTVVFDDLTNQIPATNDFYLTSKYVMSGSAQLYLNGLHQAPTYYTETTSGIKLTETLTATDELFVQYLTSGQIVTGLRIWEDGALIASGVAQLDFVGAESVVPDVGNKVIVTFSGGGGGGDPHALGSTTHTDVVITSVGDNDILAYDSGGDWINQTAAEANLAVAGHTHSDVVDVSADDTTAGYLEDKIVQGSNITITVLNDGSDEDLEIAATGLSISGHLHVETDITDLSHDAVKIRGRDVSTDAPVVGEAYRWSGTEWIPSGVSGGAGDTKKVLVSSNDTTEGYLEDKIVAGTNITVTTLSEGANETVEITSTASGGGASIVVKDEGVLLTSGVTNLDFVGTGVTATASGTFVTVTISSGVGGTEGSYWKPEAAPETPSAYDDEFDDSSFDTGLWTEMDFDTLQTISEDASGLILSQATSAGDDISGIYQSVPAGDFTITTKASLRAKLANYSSIGIALFGDATSSTGNIALGVVAGDASNVSWAISLWNDYQNWNSSPKQLVDYDTAYIRIRRTGTTYSWDFSGDGISWIEIYVTGALGWTPTHFGLAIDNNATGDDVAGVFQFFRYTNSDGGINSDLEGRRINYYT